MAANPQTQPLYKLVNFKVNGGTPRRQSAVLLLEPGQELFISRRDPVERAIQIDTFFIHDDRNNIVVISPRLLDVVRVHILVVIDLSDETYCMHWTRDQHGRATDVGEPDGFCDQSEK
jgi:hypothetical protein